MRALRTGLLLATITATALHATPGNNLPPNTVKLSQMMRELSTQPGFTEAFLKQIEGGSKKSGTALLTPDLVDRLRELIVGKDWEGLDRFPGWTMAEITPSVAALAHFTSDPRTSVQTQADVARFLDIGSYSFDTGGTIADLRSPPAPRTFQADEPVLQLGYGILRGDGPGDLAVYHAESQRLADTLNRLAANGLKNIPTATVSWNSDRTPSTPEDLIDAIMQTGQTVTVTDSRYFANFGHLHWKGQDVMMPFFLNSQIEVPGKGRPLLVPAAHAEYEWHIRGPRLNADVAFYFGVDGKAQFRTMDELDQAWVMKRDAHTYVQADAIEVTRLAGRIAQTYLRLHLAHPAVPFNGYYAFGVCQDVVAAIELKMTGTATLFPNTADDSLFTDARDAEINTLIRRLPKDRDGKAPAVERIFGSLPVAQTNAGLQSICVPGLASDLMAVRTAWTAGTLRRTEAFWVRRAWVIAVAALALLAVVLLWRFRRA